MRSLRFLSLQKLGILCVLVALSFANLRAANTDSSNTVNLPPPDSSANEALRAYLQLQEQIRETQLVSNTIPCRLMAAAQETVALSNRLQSIQESLLVQRANELDEAQRTSHMLMGVLAIFATVGFARRYC